MRKGKKRKNESLNGTIMTNVQHSMVNLIKKQLGLFQDENELFKVDRKGYEMLTVINKNLE